MDPDLKQSLDSIRGQLSQIQKQTKELDRYLRGDGQQAGLVGRVERLEDDLEQRRHRERGLWAVVVAALGSAIGAWFK